MRKYILFGFFCLLVAFYVYQRPATDMSDSTVTINSATFRVLFARSAEEQRLGLGGRVSLPEGEGMLFVFDKPSYYSFWMRGMKFPLDIIFILDGKVVGVFENLPPAADTDRSPPTWGSKLVSDRVLEINAGLVKKYNIRIGDTVGYKIKD
jgi:uncharacterized protein